MVKNASRTTSQNSEPDRSVILPATPPSGTPTWYKKKLLNMARACELLEELDNSARMGYNAYFLRGGVASHSHLKSFQGSSGDWEREIGTEVGFKQFAVDLRAACDYLLQESQIVDEFEHALLLHPEEGIWEMGSPLKK